MIRVVLADGQPIVRHGLRALLESHGCTIVAEAADGLTALAGIVALQPNVALLDLQLPDLGGLEVARRVRQQSPGTCIIIFTTLDDTSRVQEALRNGVMGYVLKDAPIDEVLAAVHAVMEGRRFLCSMLFDHALEVIAGETPESPERHDRYDLLTNREREVLQMVAQGLNYQEIGKRLAISPRTVESHRGNLVRKLQLKDHAELIQYALSRQLLPAWPGDGIPRELDSSGAAELDQVTERPGSGEVESLPLNVTLLPVETQSAPAPAGASPGSMADWSRGQSHEADVQQLLVDAFRLLAEAQHVLGRTQSNHEQSPADRA